MKVGYSLLKLNIHKVLVILEKTED